MSLKPAVLMTKSITDQLETIAEYKIEFKTLAQTLYPWMISSPCYEEIKRKLQFTEETIRSNYPETEITGVITDSGIYWVSDKGLLSVTQLLYEKHMCNGGPLPCWHCTSAELLDHHIANLRRLVILSAYDSVIVHQLKELLGDRHTYIKREFSNSEDFVKQMRNSIKRQSSHYYCLKNMDFSFYERCLITYNLLKRKKITFKKLGYNIGQLNEIQAMLKKRCEKILPKFDYEHYRISREIKESLRSGEHVQLRRTTQWERAFNMVDEFPAAFYGHTKLITFERKSLMRIVSSREEELGQSPIGMEVLQDASKIEETPMKIKATVTPSKKVESDHYLDLLSEDELLELITPD